MNRTQLVQLIHTKRSFLCVGLDTDMHQLPPHLPKTMEGVLEFNQSIIRSTLPHCVAYKLNLAFYEAMGTKGWDLLDSTIKLIPRSEALVIADAKRGDIGNTATQYAHAFFEMLNCDAITVNAYMGTETVVPFLKFTNRWTIVLALTSNPGASDFEMLRLENGMMVYEDVLNKLVRVGSEDQLMFVVGATQADHFDSIRAIVPKHFLLIPGVGAQGGKLTDLTPLLTSDCGILVNSSREIIYASSGGDYMEKAGEVARNIQLKMDRMLG